MRSRGRPGLAALFDVAGLSTAPECWHLGYLLGPRINAGGRIGNAALGATLMLAQDPAEAARIAAELDRLNRERQEIEKAALLEAEAQAEAALAAEPDAPVLVTLSGAWHPGVVGLIASRLKERFRRPAFAFAVNEAGVATGSGRSVAGADLGLAVRAAVEAGLAVKGGGHAMAAGATVPGASLPAFAAFVAGRLAEPVGEARRSDGLAVDAALTAGGARVELVKALDAAGPFGAGCPEPVFAFAGHRVVDAMEVGTGHVRVRLRAGDGATVSGIAFRAAETPVGQALLGARGELAHVAGTLSIDRYGGGERVSLRVIDVAEAV
jgi:single-stranded-DNA-specific exonuclease